MASETCLPSPRHFLPNSGTSFSNGGTLTSAANVRNSGTFTQSGPQTWGNGTSFTNDAGTATFQSNTGSASAAPLIVVVVNGTVNLAASQNLNSVTINNGHASITAGVSKTNALTFAGTLNSWMGQLDVQNNAAIVEASDSADKLECSWSISPTKFSRVTPQETGRAMASQVPKRRMIPLTMAWAFLTGLC